MSPLAPVAAARPDKSCAWLQSWAAYSTAAAKDRKRGPHNKCTVQLSITLTGMIKTAPPKNHIGNTNIVVTTTFPSASQAKQDCVCPY